MAFIARHTIFVVLAFTFAGFANLSLARDGCEAVLEAASSASLRIQKLQEISHGGQGQIYLAKDAFGNSFALKQTDQLEEELKVTNFIRVANKASADIDAIIKYERVNVDGKDYLKMPLYGQSLYQLIAAVQSGTEKVTDAQWEHIKSKLVRAVYLIHRASYVHADLKTKNVMLDENLNPIIIDFGTAVGIGARHKGGTPKNMTPNQMNGGRAAPKDDLDAGLAFILKAIDEQLSHHQNF